jgi:hypothetical protein
MREGGGVKRIRELRWTGSSKEMDFNTELQNIYQLIIVIEIKAFLSLDLTSRPFWPILERYSE